MYATYWEVSITNRLLLEQLIMDRVLGVSPIANEQGEEEDGDGDAGVRERVVRSWQDSPFRRNRRSENSFTLD